LFYFIVDSGKTGYVINKERIHEIREKYGQKYPDFLMKYGKNYYQSKSIIGALYRNACVYQKGDMEKLNNAFARLGIDDNRLQASTPMPLNSLVRKSLILFEFFIL
jgi:hypothetical protein